MLLQILIVLQFVVLLDEMVEGRTLAFLEACVLLAFTCEVAKHAVTVEP